MLVRNIYILKDIDTNEFQEPFFMRDNEVAIEHVKMKVNNKESRLYDYPQDFNLYQIGKFDYITGTVIESFIEPKFILNCNQLKSPS